MNKNFEELWVIKELFEDDIEINEEFEVERVNNVRLFHGIKIRFHSDSFYKSIGIDRYFGNITILTDTVKEVLVYTEAAKLRFMDLVPLDKLSRYVRDFKYPVVNGIEIVPYDYFCENGVNPAEVEKIDNIPEWYEMSENDFTDQPVECNNLLDCLKYSISPDCNEKYMFLSSDILGKDLAEIDLDKIEFFDALKREVKRNEN